MVYHSGRTRPIIIYDIGSKFMSDKTNFNRMLQIDPRTVYQINDKMDSAEQTRLRRLRDAWYEDVRTVKADVQYPHMTAHAKN